MTDTEESSYPIIKSPLLRTVAEYATLVLLVTFFVLALTSTEENAMLALGAFCMVGAFAASGIRGAFQDDVTFRFGWPEELRCSRSELRPYF